MFVAVACQAQPIQPIKIAHCWAHCFCILFCPVLSDIDTVQILLSCRHPWFHLLYRQQQVHQPSSSLEHTQELITCIAGFQLSSALTASWSSFCAGHQLLFTQAGARLLNNDALPDSHAARRCQRAQHATGATRLPCSLQCHGQGLPLSPDCGSQGGSLHQMVQWQGAKPGQPVPHEVRLTHLQSYSVVCTLTLTDMPNCCCLLGCGTDCHVCFPFDQPCLPVMTKQPCNPDTDSRQSLYYGSPMVLMHVSQNDSLYSLLTHRSTSKSDHICASPKNGTA